MGGGSDYKLGLGLGLGLGFGWVGGGSDYKLGFGFGRVGGEADCKSDREVEQLGGRQSRLQIGQG